MTAGARVLSRTVSRWGRLLVVASIVLAGCGGGRHHAPPAKNDKLPQVGVRTPQPAPGGEVARRPNIVLVLTDDLSSDLVRFMPHVRLLAREGMTFTNYVVSDSLCCPSRASIFTGRLPHNTHVFTNYPPSGGFQAFVAHDDEAYSFAQALYARGYRTALVGKYLNGYPADRSGHVPPGWTDWSVTDDGYPGYHYTLNEDGRPRYFGTEPKDYLTDVIGAQAQQIIADAFAQPHDRAPLFLELATFAPHLPATPAPRDLHRLPGLRAPEGPAFDVENRDPPPWLRRPRPLTPHELAGIERDYGNRARSVLDVDRVLGRILDQLRSLGERGNTYVVFSSDNGFHMGDHRLLPGKRTAFDTDIHVPLIVAGPGIRPGSRTGAIAQNIDLGPTFADIAGTRMPGADGASLLPFLHGNQPRRWRTAAIIEHQNAPPYPGDPDFQPFTAGDPPTYEALRLPHATYVEDHTSDRELYDRSIDPAETIDLYDRLTPAAKRLLAARIARLRRCRGWSHCRGS